MRDANLSGSHEDTPEVLRHRAVELARRAAETLDPILSADLHMMAVRHAQLAEELERAPAAAQEKIRRKRRGDG